MATFPDGGAQATADPQQVSFELERFAWAGPERLEVGGRWSGLRVPQLGSPELIVELKDHIVRLSPLSLAPPRVGPDGEWSAAFFWPERRPMSLGSARLEFPSGIVVDLPQASSTRLRFRHRSAHVRMAAPAPDDAAPAPDARGWGRGDVAAGAGRTAPTPAADAGETARGDEGEAATAASVAATEGSASAAEAPETPAAAGDVPAEPEAAATAETVAPSPDASAGGAELPATDAAAPSPDAPESDAAPTPEAPAEGGSGAAVTAAAETADAAPPGDDRPAEGATQALVPTASALPAPAGPT